MYMGLDSTDVDNIFADGPKKETKKNLKILERAKKITYGYMW